ncbi:MAG: hypothetical protein RLZZ301_1105 [Bacteroidota bacterium]
MQRVFVDTNIIIDLLGHREPFATDAQRLFQKAERNELSLCVSTLSLANAYYALTRTYKIEAAKNYLQLFKLLVEVVPFDEKAVELALNTKFDDLEDGFQHAMALQSQSSVLITRNKKDFKHAQLPVLTAGEFLRR